METDDYKGLSYKAKALLMDFAYQYKGGNNGALTAAFSILRERGWKREATISAAVEELIQANLIIRTREGRFLNAGGRCALYAVTWKNIDECKGKDLDMPPTATQPRKFSLKKISGKPVTQSVSGGN